MKDPIHSIAKALDRQADNMAFVLNHMSVPEGWYEKFTQELAEDRAALKAYEEAKK